jgi:hypothetical protein
MPRELVSGTRQPRRGGRERRRNPRGTAAAPAGSRDATLCAARSVLRVLGLVGAGGRGLHSSTSQLNLSRV